MINQWIRRLASVVEPSAPVPLSALDLAQLKQAVAALLLEMMYADFVVVPEERQTVTESLKCHFNLAEEELDKLLRNAEDQALGSLGWQSHLVPINELMTRQQKAQLLRCLWQLAQVDSSVHVMENAMLEQLARDMHIEPAELDEIRRASALKRKAPNTSA